MYVRSFWMCLAGHQTLHTQCFRESATCASRRPVDETHAADVQKYGPRSGLKQIIDFH